MFSFLGKLKGYLVFPSIVILIGFFSTVGYLVVDVGFVCAHSPHDIIDALELSPSYQQDQTLFIITNDRLLRSTDGGFDWKKLEKGLDNQDYLSSLAISPHFELDQTLFVSSQGDGIYKSQDGGNSWDKIKRGLDGKAIGRLAVSPGYAEDQTVLAAGTEGGLYQSDNGGESWTELMEAEVQVTAMAFSPDSKRDLMVVGDTAGQLWLSDDRGESWQRDERLTGAGTVMAVAISDRYSADGTFFVGTEQQGIFKTVDGGATFSRLQGGPSRYSVHLVKRHLKISPPDEHVVSITLSPNFGRDGTLFASTWYEAVFESNDGGQSWKKQEVGLSCDRQANTELYKSPHFREVRVSRTVAEDGTLFLAGFDGLFKSTDGGRVWSQLETLPVRLITGMGLSPASGDDFSLMITTYGGGAYTTQNSGAAWSINNAGLETTRLVDVTFSPGYRADRTLFSGASEALLRSTDGAERWERIELEKVGGRRPYPTFIVLSPNFTADQTLYFGTRRHGVVRSVDGGQTFEVMWDGMGQVIDALVISPNFVADGTLFASVRAEGIYKTEDWGGSWQPANNGLTFVERWQSASVSASGKDLDVNLVISPNYENDQTLFTGSSRAEGLFKSTDGGASWQELPGVADGGEGQIIGLGISPNYENDQTLLISVKGKGLFKTVDGGLTFTQVGSELIKANHPIRFIKFSPLYVADNTIYAAYIEEIFRSSDGGQSWTLLSRPVRYENMRDAVHYEGEWSRQKGAEYSAASAAQSDQAGSRAKLTFVGSGVSWLGTEGRDQGLAKVYIDGHLVAEVDQFNPTPGAMVTSFSMTELAYGWHTVQIEVGGRKNPASTGYRITVDALDVAP